MDRIAPIGACTVTGLATLLLLLTTVALPLIFAGMLALPGIEDATTGTNAQMPTAGVSRFFYLLGFRITRHVQP